MLTARELGDIRNTMEASFPSTCVILADQGTADQGAGRYEDWQPVGTVACRVRRELRPVEVEAGGAITSVVQVPISLPYDCGVTAANRLLVDSIQTFEVSGTDYSRSEPGCMVALGVKL